MQAKITKELVKAASKLWGLLVVGIFTFAGNGQAGEVTLQKLQEQIKQMQRSYESRISSMEEELMGLKKERAQHRQMGSIQRGIDKTLAADNPGTVPYESFFTGDNVVRSSSQMTMGGYTAFNYIDRGDKGSRFDQHRTVLEFGAKLHDRVSVYIEFEYEHGAVIEGGGNTEGELELEQAWVDFKLFDEAVFRAGTIIVPFGRYNLYHEAWQNNFVDRPLVNRRIAPTTWWEEGVGFHGQALDTESLGISYEIYAFNPGRADRISQGGGFRGLRLNGDAPIYDSKKAVAGRVAFEPIRSAKWMGDYLEVGLSAYYSAYDGFRDPATGLNFDGGDVKMFAVDLSYERGDFGFRAEGALAKAGRNRNAALEDQNGLGFYAEAYYKFWPSFLNGTPFGKDTFKKPELVGALRFDYVDLATEHFDQRDMRRVTLGMSYRPTPRVVFKFDYQMDWSPSSNGDTTLSESGAGDHTDAFLFGVALGF